MSAAVVRIGRVVVGDEQVATLAKRPHAWTGRAQACSKQALQLCVAEFGLKALQLPMMVYSAACGTHELIACGQGFDRTRMMPPIGVVSVLACMVQWDERT